MIKTITKNDYVARQHNIVKKIKKPSCMIPNQAFSVAKIMEMAKQGINLGQMREAVYDASEFPDGNPMRKQNFDLTDLDNIKAEIERAKNFHVEAKKVLEKAEKEAKKAKEKEEMKKEIEEEIEKKSKTKQKE